MRGLIRRALSISSMMLVIAACGTGDIAREFSKSEAVRLLSAGSEKSWNRLSKRENGSLVSLEECEQNNILSVTVSSSDSILYSIGELAGCDPADTQPDTLLQATWSLTQNIDLISTDTLNLTSSTGTILNPYIINQLTARTLIIQYIDNSGNTIVEEYGF